MAMIKVFNYSTSTMLVRTQIFFFYIYCLLFMHGNVRPWQPQNLFQIMDHGHRWMPWKLHFHIYQLNRYAASDWITIRIHFKKPILPSPFADQRCLANNKIYWIFKFDDDDVVAVVVVVSFRRKESGRSECKQTHADEPNT